jgi:hypothetical protein
MQFSLRGLAALLALPALLACTGSGRAQSVFLPAAPEPVVTYSYSPPAVIAPAPAVVTPAPVTSYYYTPTVRYYPAPAVSYYPAPAVSYYAAPAVSYYAAPAVSYYAAPAVSYYAAPAATVTTYRYGILPRRQVTVTNYYTPTYFVP